MEKGDGLNLAELKKGHGLNLAGAETGHGLNLVRAFFNTKKNKIGEEIRDK